MRYYDIEERKIHNMLWETVRYYSACALGGFLAGAVAIAMILIYCRMAGALL